MIFIQPRRSKSLIGKYDPQMVDVQKTRTRAEKRRGRAQLIRDVGSSPSADLDAALLDRAADQFEKSAAEVDRLRELISR